MASAFRSLLLRQFSQPSGLPGVLAGWVMATRRSNRERNRRTVELLDIRPGDRVVEIGFGPGLALRWALEATEGGLVLGVDPSPVMHRQAAARNARALAAGRLELRLGSLEDFPELRDFDCAFAVNAPAAWSSPLALEHLKRLLKAGGRLALTYEPRGPGASDGRALAAGARIQENLRSAGFEAVDVVFIPLKPVAAVCMRARRGSQRTALGTAQPAAHPGPQRSTA